METPICDFVSEYAQSGALRLHMPGHKGQSFIGAEALDITEIDGADVLYRAGGIIRQSEENAAALFGTAKTVYSAEGSSLAIRAMLYLTAVYAKTVGKRPLIAAGRNAHKTFMTAAALLDIEPVWLFPEQRSDVLSCMITGEMLERTLSEMEEKPAAVYLTSPDYLGNRADIRTIADVCHRHDVLLLVDNAHGAYLNFLPESGHPMALGADLCCDSAHKTLPVLTGGAYLHISRQAPGFFREEAERGMELFASTSPSYLILQSLDRANRYLADGYRERLAAFIREAAGWKEKLAGMGYTLVGDEPLKVSIATKPYGYTGRELADRLLEKGIVCEFSDPDYTVLMLTPENGSGIFDRLTEAFREICPRPAVTERMPALSKPVKRLSPREAMFAEKRVMDVHECRGKVLACAGVSCPPAIPIVVCGEVIDEAAIRVLDYYGVRSCEVVK